MLINFRTRHRKSDPSDLPTLFLKKNPSRIETARVLIREGKRKNVQNFFSVGMEDTLHVAYPHTAIITPFFAYIHDCIHKYKNKHNKFLLWIYMQLWCLIYNERLHMYTDTIQILLCLYSNSIWPSFFYNMSMCLTLIRRKKYTIYIRGQNTYTFNCIFGSLI